MCGGTEWLPVSVPQLLHVPHGSTEGLPPGVTAIEKSAGHLVPWNLIWVGEELWPSDQALRSGKWMEKSFLMNLSQSPVTEKCPMLL